MTSDGGVYITTAQIYDELREVHAIVRNVTVKLEDIAQHEEAAIADHEKYETRLSSLEKWRWGLTGGVAVAIGTGAGRYLVTWLGGA